jgi:hypothetical protein
MAGSSYFFSHRPGRSIVGLITPVTTRRLNVTKWRQVEIDDGFERVGCRVAMEALGDCCEPLGVLSLQREQCADGVTPTLRAAASIGGVARSGDRRVWCHLLARSIAGLAFGVAQRVISVTACARRSWRDPAGARPVQVRGSARLVASVASRKVTTAAKRT